MPGRKDENFDWSKDNSEEGLRWLNKVFSECDESEPMDEDEDIEIIHNSDDLPEDTRRTVIKHIKSVLKKI